MRFILIIFLFFSKVSFSQIALESSFNSVHIGRNQSLMLNYHFNKFQVGLGLKYNFNKLVDFPIGVFYKKTFHAINSKEHFGFEWNFKYRIFNKEHVKIHAFYNGQFSKSHIMHKMYYSIEPIVENPSSPFDNTYIKYVDLIGPFIAVENNFGLAFDIFITKNLYFAQKFGAGIALFKNLDPNTVIIGAGSWDLTEMLSFGIGFKFNDKGLK